MFILYIFFPLVCWILFIMLFTFWNRNEEHPVTTRRSAGILFLCTILPVEIQFVHTGFVGKFYPNFNTVMECWIYLCLPLTQFFLFRDLRRYKKAIRAAQQSEAKSFSEKTISK